MSAFDGVELRPLSWAKGYAVRWLGEDAGSVLVAVDERLGVVYLAYGPSSGALREPEVCDSLPDAAGFLLHDLQRRAA